MGRFHCDIVPGADVGVRLSRPFQIGCNQTLRSAFVVLRMAAQRFFCAAAIRLWAPVLRYTFLRAFVPIPEPAIGATGLRPSSIDR